MHPLVIFASGSGSNAAAIIEYFRHSTIAKVALIVCNKPEAGVLDIARREQIPFLLINKHTIHEALILEQIGDYQPALLILAGFLWKVPPALVAAYPGRILNIHPALLPSHGGKGMYGQHVHQAVITACDTTSGITIHHVNNEYDKGGILLQAQCPVLTGDTPGTLSQRVLKLEHYYYPRVIEFLLKNNL